MNINGLQLSGCFLAWLIVKAPYPLYNVPPVDKESSMNIDGLDVHPMAHIVPLADPAEQMALQNDIARNGQRVPIVLYRGKIVDGRCRALACQALKLSTIRVVLPNNMPLSEVIQQVKSWRKSGRLPFPNLPTSKVEQLADTLDYPPHGSPGADPSKSPEWESAEPLSTEEHTEQTNQGDDSERR